MNPTPEADVVLSCSACGASVYREHIDRNLAGRWAGQLLCPHCLSEKKAGHAVTPAPNADTEQISHAEEGESAHHPGRSYTGLAGLSDLDTFPHQRPLMGEGHGASRLRIFHCKLSEGPLLQMNRQVNEWLDMHPDVEIKFATTTIGTWEGRHSEQHFIMTVYY